jgi:hypothetical protein
VGLAERTPEPSLDVEVRNDSVGTAVALGVVALIVFFVVITLFAAGKSVLALLAIVVGTVIGALVLLSGAGQPKSVPAPARSAALARQRRDTDRTITAATGVAGVLGGCALGALVTGVIGIMLVLAFVAAVGNALETCLNCGNQPARHR